ncbi:hypothetical protein F6R98_10475 [Candidatus Methylospira mobilis]|uniref:SWIM-type domain-containing protein n=1 Tax=Candidatus Methylospira mobilis TaxID=1808979 RepID=A0A5Q0BLL3_9GAMM|nr:hypothetical protein [Candidatus Methylospira mobilis]QFY42987.1 hypothetical protein F6R98_10475 [Candidatus Methylospira mobilis]
MVDTSWLGKLKGSAGEAKGRLADDAAQRSAAAKEKHSIILNQNEVLTGNWDAHKVLFTTLGGKLRTITSDDLTAFRRNIQTAQANFTKGITAKQVIELSLHADRMASTEEIHMAVPVSATNGTVRYITNSGPNSKVTRHHVTVQFLNYMAEASSGAGGARKSAQRLRLAPLKFDCDCERHRYWFRYITTIGGFNAGRAETGYPKIRNPNLYGVGCKHVLRVMADIRSGGATLAFLTRLLKKGKAADNAKAAVRQAQSEAEKVAANQEKRKSAKELNAIRKAVNNATKPKNLSARSRQVKRSPDPEEAIRVNMRAMGIKDERQIESMIQLMRTQAQADK